MFRFLARMIGVAVRETPLRRENLEDDSWDAAMDAALTRFPGDPYVREAKAIAEFELREFRGRRPHDA